MQEDRDFFHNVGKMASDKFYKNDDMRKIASLQLKNGSKQLAETFQSKYTNSMQTRQEIMA